MKRGSTGQAQSLRNKLNRGLLRGWAIASGVCLGCASPPATVTPAPAPAAPSSVASAPVEAGGLAPAPASVSLTDEPIVFSHELRAAVDLSGELGRLSVYRLRLDPEVRRLMSEETREQLQSGVAVGRVEFEVVSLDPEVPLPHAFVRPLDAEEDERLALWLAVPKGGRLPSTLRLLSAREGGKNHVFSLRVEGGTTTKSSDVSAPYRAALREYLGTRQLGGFGGFANERLERVGHAFRPSALGDDASTRGALLAEGMSFWSGQRSLELAIYTQSFIPPTSSKKKVALTSLAPPEVPSHDYAAMVRGLGGAQKSAPLYSMIPADFYVIHAQSGEALVSAMRQAREIALPMLHIMDSGSMSAEISSRYLTQLGLSEGELVKRFGPSAISEVALVGSDLFLRKGSDVTLLFRAKSESLLSAGLAMSLAQASEGHGELTTTLVKGPPPRRVVRSADGEVVRVEATLGDYVVLSNSQKAVDKLAEVFSKGGASLAKEHDFQYLMTRDGNLAFDVRFFAGDRFFREMASPRSRILDARRNLAHAELRRVSYAQLLAALLGEGPDLAPEKLVALGLLRKEETVHFDGSKITVGEGGVPMSRYGTPRQLTPLLELDTPGSVGEDEAEHYRSFALDYARLWRRAIDPVSIAMTFDEGGLKASVRVFPIVMERDTQEARDFVGDAHFEAGRVSSGVRLGVAISKSSSLRRQAESFGPAFLGEGVNLDFLGDVLFVGLLDQEGLVTALAPELRPQAKGASRTSSTTNDLLQLPIYFGISVSNRQKAQLALDVVRAALAKNGGLTFREQERFGEIRITEVAVQDGELNAKVYFALGEKTLYVALQPAVIRHVLEREKAGVEPKSTGASLAASSQLDLQVRFAKTEALRKVLSWAHEHENKRPGFELELARLGFRALAAEPHRDITALLLGRLGEVPLSRDGLPLRLGPYGLEEPERGSLFRPTLPSLPVKDSDLEKLMRAVQSFSASIAFEPEVTLANEPQESLRIRLEMGKDRAP